MTASSTTLDFFEFFGLPAKNLYLNDSVKKSQDCAAKIHKIAGYIPIISIVSGLAKIILCVYLALDANNNARPSKEIICASFLALKGVSDLVGFGILSLTVDSSVTLVRYIFDILINQKQVD